MSLFDRIADKMSDRFAKCLVPLAFVLIAVGLVIFFKPEVFSFMSNKDDVTPPAVEVQEPAPVQQVVRPADLRQPNEDESGGEAETVPDVNIGSGGEALDLAADGTFTEPEQEAAPSGNTESGTSGGNTSSSGGNTSSSGGSSSSGGGSSSSGGTTTYSDGSIGHNGVATVNGITYTGLREFASVADLEGQRPTNGKPTETVVVNGVPYKWTGYEWGDLSGFYTEVVGEEIGTWDGTYVGY